MSDIKITVRLPVEVHEALVKVARDEDRSLNQQIVRLVRNGLAEHGKGRR